MARLPIKVKEELLKMNNDQVEWVCNILGYYEKAEEDRLMDWIREKGQAYYQGRRDSLYSCIEDMLMAYNCYHGFTTIDKNIDYRSYYIV